MSENRFGCSSQSNSRENICIEANRVLDSCRDRDCYENVRVFLTNYGNEIIDRTGNVRVKGSCVAGANISASPIAFNRGFYSVDIRIYVRLFLEGCVGNGRSQDFEGIAVLDKKVVLYGGESNLNVFRSQATNDFCSTPMLECVPTNAPTVVLETVDPIVLGIKVLENTNDCNCCCCCCDIPETVTQTLNGNLTDTSDNGRFLSLSIGTFSVVRIERPAQFLISGIEYSVPDKECISQSEESPCSIFKNMAFPIQEFSPQMPNPTQGTGCGNNKNTDRGCC